MTKLDKPLKRELALGEETYVVTISPEGLKLTLKGHRKGREIPWRELVGGEAASESVAGSEAVAEPSA
jgi:hypothetical protein